MKTNDRILLLESLKKIMKFGKGPHTINCQQSVILKQNNKNNNYETEKINLG